MLAKTIIDEYASFEVCGFYDCAIYMSDHCATHVDSTIHFNPNGKSIDQIPLELWYNDGCVLDLSYKKTGEDITPEDLEKAAEKAGVDLTTTPIVLIRTDRSKLWGKREYHWDIVDLTTEGAEWLINKGVKVIGVDMVCIERDRIRFRPDASLKPWDSMRYPVHSLMKKYEFFIIENLANLDKIPKPKFKFIGFPLGIKGASGSPIRAVALID